MKKKESAFSGEIESFESLNTFARKLKLSLPALELEEFEPVYTSDEQNIELFLKMYPNVEMRVIQLNQSVYRLEEDLKALLNEKESIPKKVLAVGRVNSHFTKVSKFSQMIPILVAFIFCRNCTLFNILINERRVY